MKNEKNNTYSTRRKFVWSGTIAVLVFGWRYLFRPGEEQQFDNYDLGSDDNKRNKEGSHNSLHEEHDAKTEQDIQSLTNYSEQLDKKTELPAVEIDGKDSGHDNISEYGNISEYNNFPEYAEIYTQEYLAGLGVVYPLGEAMTIIQVQKNNRNRTQINSGINYATMTYAMRHNGAWHYGATGHISETLQEYAFDNNTLSNIYVIDVTGYDPSVNNVHRDHIIHLDQTPVAASPAVDTIYGNFGILHNPDIINETSMPVGIPTPGYAEILTELDSRGPIRIPVQITGLSRDQYGRNAAIVKTPEAFNRITGESMGLLDFFKGQSGSPIIQDGKFVAVASFVGQNLNGAIWAADMVRAHREYLLSIEYNQRFLTTGTEWAH